MVYNAQFDGIRGIAVLLVVGFHCHMPMAASGYVGVDIFFVLSGFLITKILADEHVAYGRIAVSRFYLRRGLRLYPNLLLMLVGYAAFAAVLSLDQPVLSDIIWAALYLSDYSRAFLGEPRMISHTWSLAVEEHFYLLWPLVVPFLVRAKQPLRILLVAFAVATVWRGVNLFWLGWDAAYFRFDTRMSGLLLGSALAFARWEPSKKTLLISTLTLVFLVCVPSYGRLNGLTAVSMASEICALILVAYAFTGKAKLLANRSAVYVGKLSYGIYLWHFPIAYYLRDDFHWAVTFAAALSVSVMVASLIYHFIERPITTWYRTRPKITEPVLAT